MATVNAAAALGLSNSVGAIEVGRAADIIAVDGNPLVDIGALSRVVFVMHDGRVVRSRANQPPGGPGRPCYNFVFVPPKPA